MKKKRRLKGNTDYKARLAMLKSGKARLVIRKSSKYVYAQIVLSKEGQDSIVCGADTKMLRKQRLNSKNITACYVLGRIIGKKAKEKKIDEAIADIAARSTKGSRIYAVIKGAIDSGLKINCSKELFPSEERIKGEHLKNKVDFQKIIKETEK